MARGGKGTSAGSGPRTGSGRYGGGSGSGRYDLSKDDDESPSAENTNRDDILRYLYGIKRHLTSAMHSDGSNARCVCPNCGDVHPYKSSGKSGCGKSRR